MPYAGSFRGVGIANRGRPTLINETGGELIVDPATTNNIRLRDPGVFDLIKSYQVPQRAEGTLPESNSNFQQSIDNLNRNQAVLVDTQNKLVKTVDQLRSELKKCISISAEKASEDLQEWDNFENDIGY
ncbi:MAG: hypothetical protein R6V23_06620 [Bacteroidales bacterium]